MADVNRDMTIQDVLKLNPKTAAVFLRNGMHCIGCHIGFDEKVGEAAEAHGVDVEKLMRELVAGVVGTQAAASFYGYLKNRDIRIPSTASLLQDYSLVKEDIQNLINHKHIEIIHYVIKKVVIGFEMKIEQIRSINGFLEDLPQELQVLFFKYLSVKRPEDVDALIEKSKVFETISDRIIDIISAE